MKPAPPKQPSWRARYRDPETGKIRFDVLSAEAAKTAQSRTDFAIDLCKSLARRRDAIHGGAAKHTDANMAIEDAFEKYFSTVGLKKSPRTQRGYRDSCDLFLEWAKNERPPLKTVRQLSKGKLAAFAASRLIAPKLAGAVTRRGKRTRRTELQRSTFTSNREIREVGTVLRYLRRLETVSLTSDDLKDGLKRETVVFERKGYLRPAELRALLEACRRHDAEVFKITRNTKAIGKGAPDEPRYTPIFQVVLFILLSGMRVKEALGIERYDVEIDAAQLHVRAKVAKTKDSRVVDLEVSPLLAWLVGAGGHGRLLDKRWTIDSLHAARKRLLRDFSAPPFTYQALRRTCGTFLTCSPSIFGAASAYMSAKQLGHSVTVAEKHYVGITKVSPNARTLEDAMQLNITPGSCPRL